MTRIASPPTTIGTLAPSAAPKRRGRKPLAPAEKARRALKFYVFRVLPTNDVHPDYAPVRGPSSGPEEEREDEALKASIAKDGIRIPLVVAKIPKRNEYRLVDGARRYKAAQEVGLAKVPCQVFGVLSRAEFELLRWDSQNAKDPLWMGERDAEAFEVVRKARETRPVTTS